ncbi:MAG: glycosyltransferase [Petrotogales bacterium]
MKHFENTEKEEDFYIDPNWWKNRPPGISCYFRVKNEEEFIKPSILSVINYVDEVIIALQPSVDKTREIIESIDSPKIKIIDYPFELMPNGPGFKDQDNKSVHCKTYYYNWTLSKTKFDWAIKWDGDMVALPSIKNYLKRQVDRRFFGHEIVKIKKDGDWYLSRQHPESNAAPSGLFKVHKELEYMNADQTHVFNKPQGIKTPKQFLHFKWCKKHFDDIWKKDWKNIPKFKNLCNRAIPGPVYLGEKPEVLLPFITEDMGFENNL